MRIFGIFLGILSCSIAYASDDQVTEITQEPIQEIVQPFTKAEIQQGMLDMQNRLTTRIEDWGKTLQKTDFEWTWQGRQLKQPKRQEVCNIFQGVVNETYAMAQKNKARLSPEEQKRLQNRGEFIQALGFENNIVDTRMGFNCRLR